MAVTGDIQAVLTELATGGCHAVTNESQTIVWPYITFMRIDSRPDYDLEGSGLNKGLYQIDILAKSYGEVKTIAEQVKTALENGPFKSVVQVQDRDWPEDGSSEFRVLQEYSIWS